MNIELMLCVNDVDNGLHTGRVDGIDLYDGEIVLSLRGQPLKCDVVKSRTGKGRSLQIGHIYVPLVSYGTWVGNWCWDSAEVSIGDAVRVVNYLRKRKWDCEQGYSNLYEMYHAGQDISLADLEFVFAAEVAD